LIWIEFIVGASFGSHDLLYLKLYFKIMTLRLFFLLLFSIQFAVAQDLKMVIYNEKTDKGYKMFIDNNEFCPISIRIHFELTNLSSTNGNNKVFVIPAQTKGYLFTELELIQVGKYGFSYKTMANYGDDTLTSYDTDFVYSLPFEKGKTFKIFQGYNGKSTHHNENALDFDMPIGTPILASREGIVVKVVQNYTQRCFERKCAEYNNYIFVYHPDGTFARYVHLKKDGALVKEGDVIKQDQLIGYSGDVGWASGPHLHFMVFLQKIESQQTLQTKFKINNGDEIIYLEEGKSYSKNY
jgi:murein DD-endopeptidase MepM/ murein hydrolase activator NlpD